MPLSTGARLGPYEILAALGAGGMGEVWRARDTRLNRTVAIKVLSETLAADPQFRERFDREARLISQLTHPHICTLYDVGEQAGISYLVMEYLEGETLADRLKEGALPLDRALRITIEVAEALDALHRLGVVHRDLKPANVMLTAAGAKLLDFGIATTGPALKPFAMQGDSRVQGTIAPTRAAGRLTGAGTIMGTLEYMAPEQVEGREADARTDIWALGCVLYEMIRGVRAFDGSAASVLAGILEREPAAISPATSPGAGRLWEVIRTCLEKRPDDRWQSVRDLARELRWCLREQGTSAPASTLPVMSRRRWLALGTLAVAALVAIPAAWISRATLTNTAAAAGPPVIVLMDSTRPEGIYDAETRKAGGTNADDLTDLLRDLPVRLVKENTNATWHREYAVLQESPALIVAHRSCFYDSTMLGEASRQLPFYNLSWDKFESFAGFVALGNPHTKILAYSRGTWSNQAASAQWVTSMERRFPPLAGRLDAMPIPLDRATFRNAATGAEIRARILALLHLKTTG